MKNYKIKNLIIFISKFFILIICGYIMLLNLKNPQFKLSDYIFNLNFYLFLILLFFTFLINFIQLNLNRLIYQIYLNRKLEFLSFSKLFFNAQLLNILIPYSGNFYKAYFLKKLNLKYKVFLSIYFYFFLFGMFYFFLLYSLEIFIFGDILAINKNLVSIFFALISFSALFTLYFHKKIEMIINLLKLKIFTSLIELIFSFFKIKNFKKVSMTMIKYNSILHLLNFLIIFLIIENISQSTIDFNTIMIFFVINSVLDQLPITPRNIGVSEVVFGLSANSLGMSFEFGLAIKLILRAVYFVHLIISTIIVNILSNDTI